MKISLNWLKRYVDIPVSVEELCSRMVMAGFEVEDIEDLSQTMKNVVVARILRLEKHPDADKLQLCRMDVGGDTPIQIITGATNVFEGALVPAALHDSYLPNGAHIKRGKLRGLPSEGMLCSGEELGLKESDYPGAEVNGILILQEDAAPGTDLRDLLGLNDTVIDFKITANRPDCQSVLGVAREVSVVLRTAFHPPVPSYQTTGGDIREHIAITVEDYDLCPRYLGRVVQNLRIAPSPKWMRESLRAAGMRPINNIVDITNFVMLETGQPMHAFDLRDVRGRQILVRRAHPGEPITTLDGRDHTLTADMLVVADAEAPSCLAGIMGGLDSEIKEDTRDLFLECAKFRRDSVRRTARALGIRTESSARFEKGVDIRGVEYAMERALQLISELDAGDIVEGAIDRHQGLPEDRVLSVPVSQITALLGVEVPEETMVDILNRLSIQTTLKDHVLTSRVPSFRDDVEGRADLAEEVMRIHGYDHIRSTPMQGEITRGKKLPQLRNTDILKTILTAQGLREITTYSFISAKASDLLSLPESDPRRSVIPLLNPLGEDYAVLRTQLVTSMLTVLSTNKNRKNPTVRLFEVGKLFVPKSLPLTEQPDEIPALCIGLYGQDEDFFTLKGIVEALLARFGADASFIRSCEPFLHPGRQARVQVGETSVGVLGELHPDTAERFGLDTRVYVAELRLEPLFACAGNKRVIFRPLPRYPAVERDLALVCDEGMPVADIQQIILRAGGRHLESVELFDVYQGAQIEKGKKSVAFSLRFRDADGTLADEDIEPALHKIFTNLQEKGCILRS